MKKHVFFLLNLFTGSLLLAALYLNFIYKENDTAAIQPATVTTGTVLVKNPEAYLLRGTIASEQILNKNSLHP